MENPVNIDQDTEARLKNDPGVTTGETTVMIVIETTIEELVLLNTGAEIPADMIRIDDLVKVGQLLFEFFGLSKLKYKL